MTNEFTQSAQKIRIQMGEIEEFIATYQKMNAVLAAAHRCLASNYITPERAARYHAQVARLRRQIGVNRVALRSANDDLDLALAHLGRLHRLAKARRQGYLPSEENTEE